MRNKIYEKLFSISENWYRKYMKRNTVKWNITLDKLKQYKEGQLGREYYEFLTKNGFSILPKLESHDIFHVLTGTNTKVKDEISMQFYLFANGKRSLYQAIVMLSSIFYVEHLKFFIKQYKKGKAALPFHELDFENMLEINLSQIKTEYKIVS